MNLSVSGESTPVPPSILSVHSWRSWVLIICCAVLLSFGSSLRNGFVIDDETIVQMNPKAASITQIKQILTNHYWATSPEGDTQATKEKANVFAYRPLTIFSFALTSSLFGMSERNHHAVNIILHLINALLTFWVVRLWVRSTPVAGITGLLFAVHPLHVEVVNLLVGRSELLAFTGGASALVAIYFFFESPKHQVWWGILAGILWFLGLCAKETGVLFFGLTALLIWFITLHNVATPFSLERLKIGILQTKWLSFAIIVPIGLYAYLRHIAIGGYIGVYSSGTVKVNVEFIFNPLFNLPFGDRWMTGMVLIGKYIQLHIWPSPLLVDYSYNIIPTVTSVTDGRFLISTTVVIGLCIWTLWQRNRQPVCLIGMVFWLTGMACFSNIFLPFGTIFGERLMYTPSFGFCLVSAFLLKQLWGKTQQPLDQPALPSNAPSTPLTPIYSKWLHLAIVAGAGSVLLISMVYCHVSNAVFVNTQTAILHTLEQSEGKSAWQWYTVGCHYAAVGKSEEAVFALNKSTEIYPIDDAYDTLARLYISRQEADKAVQSAYRAVELSKDWWPYRKRLAIALVQAGKPNEAVLEFKEILKVEPHEPLIHLSLAFVQKKLGHLVEAESHFQEALKGTSPQPIAYQALGDLYLAQGRRAEALTAFQAYLQTNPPPEETKQTQDKIKILHQKLPMADKTRP